VARKQDEGAKATKPSKAKGGRKTVAETRRTGATRSVLDDAAETVAAAPGKAGKAMKRAKTKALNLMPETPTLPRPQMPDIDVGQTVREIGSQVMTVLNSPTGRVIVAEVLIHLAKAMTRAAANTETGRDVKETALNAGAKIGAAVAAAGAKMLEGGQDVAQTGVDAAQRGAEAAGEAATNASDIARQVASVAVNAVGGVVAQAASRVMAGSGPSASAGSAGTGEHGETRREGQDGPSHELVGAHPA